MSKKKTTEELENEIKMKKGKQQLQEMNKNFISMLQKEMDKSQKLLIEQCKQKNLQQDDKKSVANPYDATIKLVQPLNDATKKVKDTIMNHGKLQPEAKQRYQVHVTALINIFKNIGPQTWMSIKAGDKWFKGKLDRTQQIIGEIQTQLDQLARAGCCGVGSVKKNLEAQFPKLEILVENFWRTITEMKLNAKEGLEYQPFMINSDAIIDQLRDKLSQVEMVVVNQVKTEQVEGPPIHIIDEKKVVVEVPKYIKEQDLVKEAYQLCYGIGKPQHISEGLKLLEAEAAKEDISAINALGKIYHDGDIVSKDLDLSYHYYSKSATLKDPEGTYRIGHFYEKGDILRLNNSQVRNLTRDQMLQKAVEQYKEAVNLSKNSHLDALTDLGFIYEYGLPENVDPIHMVVKPDPTQAENYYKLAVAKSFPRAMNNLGRLYQFQGQKKKAFQLFQQAISCKGGYARASYNMGICYQRGYGTVIDLDQARFHYRMAYEKGDLYGKLSYSYFLLQDAVDKDDIEGYREVLKMLRSVLAKDDTLSEAYYYLAYMYENGFGITACEETAMDYYEEACKRNLPKALNKMGEIYEFGMFGLSSNMDKAIQYYNQSAELGDENAMINLGKYYEAQESEDGYKNAYEWYKKSAKLGSHSAQTHIAELYRHGKGVQKDENLAIEYLQMGAKKDGNARYILEEITTRAVLEQQQQNSMAQIGNEFYSGSPGNSSIYQSGINYAYQSQIRHI